MGLGLGAPRRLLDRHGLTGQGRFADKKVLGRNQSEIGRDYGAGMEKDDIAGHDLRDPDLALHPVPEHQGAGLNPLAQGLHGQVGPAVEDRGQADGEHDHRADDNR